MINTEKVVQHAGSHRILHALNMRDCTSKELKNVVGAINSISKFDGEYMARMFSNGYVIRCDAGWTLTDKGRRKFEQLGPARGMPGLNATARVANSFQNKGDYKGEKALPLRPGAEDFLKLPSRIGNTLHYRDGRKETVNE